MTRRELFSHIQKKETYLCVGLDTDLDKIPSHLLRSSDPIFEFNKQIIDATCDYCVAYKPNLAFYEALGSRGWESLEKTIDYIPKDLFCIADAKRGDIGNTGTLYARAFFDQMTFDAVTVSPYMGKDSITPFLREGKWAIVLAHTSNAGSGDFQQLKVGDKEHKLYEDVVLQTLQWSSCNQIMYVVGATHPDSVSKIRQLAPDHFLLIPGVGTQGGDLDRISACGMNAQCGLLVNASRSILYASSGKDFAAIAKKRTQEIRTVMHRNLALYG